MFRSCAGCARLELRTLLTVPNDTVAGSVLPVQVHVRAPNGRSVAAITSNFFQLVEALLPFRLLRGTALPAQCISISHRACAGLSRDGSKRAIIRQI